MNDSVVPAAYLLDLGWLFLAAWAAIVLTAGAIVFRADLMPARKLRIPADTQKRN